MLSDTSHLLLTKLLSQSLQHLHGHSDSSVSEGVGQATIITTVSATHTEHMYQRRVISPLLIHMFSVCGGVDILLNAKAWREPFGRMKEELNASVFEISVVVPGTSCESSVMAPRPNLIALSSSLGV